MKGDGEGDGDGAKGCFWREREKVNRYTMEVMEIITRIKIVIILGLSFFMVRN